RHLPPLGLSNAWGYNPVTFMALDPRLAPGGLKELRDTVAALRKAGIGTILDLVFNHTGESDRLGPTLSLRGLDALAYYRHQPDGRLVNDTGTGNTIACDHPVVREMVLDTLRHFVRFAGVDGFR
ncbi:MAG: glycogen debranching enzyme GlgX, partial [Mesorhizobium sp.]